MPDWFDAVVAAADGGEIVAGDFADTDLRGLRWERLTFSNCSFEGAALDDLVTEGCTFTACTFDRTELVRSTHTHSAFIACSFNRTRITGTVLNDCKLSGSTFVDVPLKALQVSGGGDFSAASFGGADMRELNLSNVKLVGANLVGAKLDRAVLNGANLTDVRWGDASLREADLRGATLGALDPRTVDLRGARVDVEQALQLAAAMGLLIG